MAKRTSADPDAHANSPPPTRSSPTPPKCPNCDSYSTHKKSFLCITYWVCRKDGSIFFHNEDTSDV